VTAQDGMLDQAAKLHRVDGLDGASVKIGVDVSGERDAEGIVRVDADNACVVTNELFKLIGIADDDIVGGELATEQQGFHHAQAVGNVLRLAVGRYFIFHGPVRADIFRVPRGQRRQQHLAPGAAQIFVRL